MAQILAAHHLHRHGLADGDVEGVDQPLEQRQGNDLPDLDQMAQGQERQRRRLQHRGALRQQQHGAPFEAVGDHAAKDREEEHRHLAGEGNQAQQQRRMRQAVDQPALRHIGNPGPHQRGELAGEEQPIIAMAKDGEKGEGGPARRAAVGRGLAPQHFGRRHFHRLGHRNRRRHRHVFRQNGVDGAG
jgi:hypothetical protein